MASEPQFSSTGRLPDRALTICSISLCPETKRVEITHDRGRLFCAASGLIIRNQSLYLTHERRYPYASDLSDSEISQLTALGVPLDSPKIIRPRWSHRVAISTSWYTGHNDRSIIASTCGFLGLFREDDEPDRKRYRRKIWDYEAQTYQWREEVIDHWTPRPFLVLDIISGLVLCSFHRKGRAIEFIERCYSLPFSAKIWRQIRALIAEHELGL